MPPARELLTQDLIRSRADNDQLMLANSLRYYLMLFNPQLREPQALSTQLADRWLIQKQIDEAQLIPTVSLLTDLWEVNRLNQQPDTQLIAKSREQLAELIDSQLVYEKIKALPEYAQLTDLGARFGKQFNQVFTFKNTAQAPTIPYLFTRAGYKSLDLSPKSELLAQMVGNLNLVHSDSTLVEQHQLALISDQVRERYYREYIRVWKDLIAQIHLRRPTHSTDATALLNGFYRGEQPALFELIAGISAETQLVEVNTQNNSKNDQKLKQQLERQATRAIKVQGSTKRLARTATLSAMDRIKKQRNAQVVNDAFASYAIYETDQGELVIKTLGALAAQNHAFALSAAPDRSRFKAVADFNENGSNIITTVQQLASSSDNASQIWLHEMADIIWQQWVYGAERHIQTQWKGIHDNWQALNSYFPFNPNSDFEVRAGDFITFFKPSGQLDQFAQTYVTPFMQKQGSRFYPRSLNGTTIRYRHRFLAQLSNSERLRKQLFDREGILQVKFKLRATNLSPRVTRFQLRENDQLFSYSHGPALWLERSWPRDNSDTLTANFYHNSVRLAQKTYQGYWAWLRFIFDSQLKRSGPRLQVHYKLKDTQVELELLPQNDNNPFDRSLYTTLHLPVQAAGA